MRLILILSILMSGCSSIPHLSVYDEAKQNFIYIEDEADEWLVYDRIDEPFMGDCEDFAFTLQKQIGGEVWKVHVYGIWHAVLLKDGFVYDNIRRTPITIFSYRGWFVEIIW